MYTLHPAAALYQPGKALVQIAEWVRWKRSSDSPDIYAASTAFQIAGATWPLNRSRSNVNCPFVDTSEQFYASDYDGRFEVLEAKHRAGSEFDTTMVLFDEVVQVLREPQFRVPGQQVVLSHLMDCAMRRRIAIEADRVRRPTVIPDHLFQECLGCRYISCPTEPEVDSLPSLVYCPIQIGPLSAHLEIGFIESSGPASAAAKAISPLDELWCIPSNPAQDRRMGSWRPRSAIISTRSRELSL
jgi:hypothetical protein